ncbi:PASTA domain-containing protein [Antrihabitans sp. YC2-6]|uniref:PASTA domain-containing protein n=1 Tax=Antrihabitans sp. YC2-6 TaxID=2799498 RepID=UPI001F232A2E|nr:PASTA domain-containing protein [Antrihabitans sp. YC2-6]
MTNPPPAWQPPPNGFERPNSVAAKPKKKWPWVVGGLAVLVVIAAAVGGGKDKDEPVAVSDAIPSTARAAVAQTTTAATSIEQTPLPLPAASVVPPVVQAPVAPPVPERQAGGLMPNVVCMNLQDAQDLIQESGVFYSRSFDATGDGRNQIIDSNWLVVSQNIPPGTPFDEGDANLGAVKYGESNPC